MNIQLTNVLADVVDETGVNGHRVLPCVFRGPEAASLPKGASNATTRTRSI